jgi:hypothetical protein
MLLSAKTYRETRTSSKNHRLYIHNILRGNDGVKKRLIVMDPVEEREVQVVQLCERAAYRNMVKDIKSRIKWRSTR